MDEEIYEELTNYFIHLKFDVEYIELRTYKIRIVLNDNYCTIIYKWDGNLTFNKNIDNIKKEVEQCILKYYKRQEII